MGWEVRNAFKWFGVTPNQLTGLEIRHPYNSMFCEAHHGTCKEILPTKLDAHCLD